jgi:hypothetical protein
MKQLVEFPLQDGTSVLIKVEDAHFTGVVCASHPGEVAAKARAFVAAAGVEANYKVTLKWVKK